MSKVLFVLDWIYRVFAYFGESILKCPNKAFYLLIVIFCILAPFFSVIAVITLLCGVYRRYAH